MCFPQFATKPALTVESKGGFFFPQSLETLLTDHEIMEIAWWKGQIYVSQNVSLKRKKKRGHCKELGSNYLLISRDFENCMVIRAIYFKVFALANR